MVHNTRIAPSPTGHFHIGTARTAYHNWLVARATGGKFILRIDDTDSARNDDAHIKTIYDCMLWLGLDYDLTFGQSRRDDTYKKAADQLIASGQAIYADNGAVLFKPSKMPDSWTDSITGSISLQKDDRDVIDGMVLMKSDGKPTYNFASIVDDIDTGVNHVIRGVDHVKNTPKQVAIATALTGKCDIMFTHVGLIHGKNGKKISKRDGALSVTDYQSLGVVPDALLNFILRMGWSPSDPNFDQKYKKIDKATAVDLVMTAGGFNNNPAKLDMDKLSFLNRKHGGKAIQVNGPVA